jgi:predicted Zn-dependent peptidase
VQRIEIDGVPVFTAPGPGRASAALVFGVGIRDETYATLGITHLIEHLAMGALPKSHLESNATVDVESTVFFASGRPQAVADFVTRVCAALSDLPTDRIDLETGVLEAENCHGSHPTAAALWGARFRLNGPGLALAGGGVPCGLTEEQVRAHAQKWFVRSNAALAWHGELPADLRVGLPDGPRPERPAPEDRPQDRPVWMQGATQGVGLLLTSAPTPNHALNVAVEVLESRLTDVARHQRGLSYSVTREVVDVAPGRREVAVVVDAREGQEAAVAAVLWEQYRALCEGGPTAEEIAHAVEGFAEFLDGNDDAVAAELGQAAFASVFGLPVRTAADALAAQRAVTVERSAEALRATVPTAILLVPDGVEPEFGPGIERRYLCNYVPELPAGPTFRPPLLARVRHKEARLRLVVTDDGLAHGDADGDGHLIPWSEVEAALPAVQGSGIFVVGRNLCGIDVHEDIYGRRAVEAVRSRLPQHVWVPAPRRSEENARVSPPGGGQR